MMKELRKKALFHLDKTRQEVDLAELVDLLESMISGKLCKEFGKIF